MVLVEISFYFCLSCSAWTKRRASDMVGRFSHVLQGLALIQSGRICSCISGDKKVKNNQANCLKPANIRPSVRPPRNRIQPSSSSRASFRLQRHPLCFTPPSFCNLKNPATQTHLCFLEHMATLMNNFLSFEPAILAPELSRGADACGFCMRHRYWDGVMPSPFCTVSKTYQHI